MKFSFYNVFVPRKGDYVLYNTLYDSMAVIDAEMKETLESGKFDSLPENFLTLMKSEKFLVEDDVNELDIFRTERKYFQCTTFGTSLNVTFIISYACNLACPYCDEILAKDRQESMSTETADIALTFVEKEAVKENYIRKVSMLLYGGEPLVNWPCCQHVLNQLVEMGERSSIPYDVQIISNGTLFTDSIIHELTQHPVSRVDITFDGCKEDHDRRRITHEGKGTYDTIMDTLVRLVDAGITTAVKVNVDKENHTRIEMLFEDLEDHGLSGVPLDINPISYPKLTPHEGPTYCMQEEDLPVILPHTWRLASEWGFLINKKPGKKSGCCMNSDFSSYIIDPLLHVYKCSEFVGLPDHIVGEITEDGEFEPNTLFFYGMARDPTYLEKCSTCALLPVCTEAPCVALSYGMFKNYYETRCYKTKYLFEEHLTWHLDLLDMVEDQAVQESQEGNPCR